MPKCYVYAEAAGTYVCTVEADSEAEAQKKACADGGAWVLDEVEMGSIMDVQLADQPAPSPTAQTKGTT